MNHEKLEELQQRIEKLELQNLDKALRIEHLEQQIAELARRIHE